MADIESTISSILSDPDAMKKIRQLGDSLGLTSQSTGDIPKEEPKPNNSGFDLSALSSLLGESSQKASVPDGDTLSSLTKFLPLIKGFNQEDESTALLNALRPFLSNDKRRRLDDAAKMLRIMRMLPLLKTQGLF